MQDNEQAEIRLKEAVTASAELVKLQPTKPNIYQAFSALKFLSDAQMNLALKLNDQRYMEEVKKNLQKQEALLAILPEDPDLAQLAKQLQEMKAMIKD